MSLVELLEVAVNGKGAFRHFKDVLLNYPEEEERWFQIKDGRLEKKPWNGSTTLM